MMKLPATVIFECKTKYTRVMYTKKDAPGYYEAFGRWVSDSVRDIAMKCHEEGVAPCMHVIPRQLTKEQFEKLDAIDWHIEKGKLIRDVERRRAEN